MDTEARRKYRELRRHGVAAVAAYEYATTEQSSRDSEAEAEAEALDVVVICEPDHDPDVSWLGEFTGEWSPDAVLNSTDRRFFPYFLPETTVREHREGLSALGYARGPAETLARKYVRRDMAMAREPELYVVSVVVGRDDVTLGTAHLGGCMFDAARDWSAQVAETVAAHGMVDEALAEARLVLCREGECVRVGGWWRAVGRWVARTWLYSPVCVRCGRSGDAS